MLLLLMLTSAIERRGAFEHNRAKEDGILRVVPF